MDRGFQSAICPGSPHDAPSGLKSTLHACLSPPSNIKIDFQVVVRPKVVILQSLFQGTPL
jgi:hypothetical protein